MKKSLVAAALLALLGCGALAAQDLANVVKDLNTVFELLGYEITPYVLQGNLAGEGIGGSSPPAGRWYLAVSVGSVLSGGPLAFVKDEGRFEVLDVNSLFDKALSGTASDAYGYAKSFLPLPGLRLTVGIPDWGGSEVVFLASIFPQPVSALVEGFVGIDSLVFNRLNLGLRIRRPLVREGGGFPAISAGAGYTFSRFGMGLAVPTDFTQEIGGQPLALDGDLLVTTMVNAIGAELGISKKLGVFVPFFRLSSYLTWVRYTGEISDFYAALGDPPLTQTNGPVSVSLDEIGSFLLFSGGFELQGRRFSLITTGNFSFDSMRPGVTIASRWQF